MSNNITKRAPTGNDSPFERIKRINNAGGEYWSSRDFSQILGYSDYRNFEQVIKKAKKACFNSGHRIEDHFVDITEMVDIDDGRVGLPKIYLTILIHRLIMVGYSTTLQINIYQRPSAFICGF